MWILIECEDQINGPGHDEKRRYILSDYLSIAPHPNGGVAVMSLGDEVHPCTPGDNGYHCPICHKDIKPAEELL